ncbi:hypothetical protein XENOCAPTIV_008836 [Xenoophorus captivus]|uniref:Uncharacterized protein n=1 Tax=Xenoophorus captivus TaxID=1517983 RepID=A0ABV0S659_9TELE
MQHYYCYVFVLLNLAFKICVGGTKLGGQVDSPKKGQIVSSKLWPGVSLKLVFKIPQSVVLLPKVNEKTKQMQCAQESRGVYPSATKPPSSIQHYLKSPQSHSQASQCLLSTFLPVSSATQRMTFVSNVVCTHLTVSESPLRRDRLPCVFQVGLSVEEEELLKMISQTLNT